MADLPAERQTDEEFYREATRVLGELAAKAGTKLEVWDDLGEELSTTRTTLERIERSLSYFALEEDVTRRRQLSLVRVIFLIMWVAIMMMGITTAKVEACSPGARAEDVMLVFLEEEVDIERLRDTARKPAPGWCDVAFPVAAHSLGSEWPTHENVMGLALYGAFAGLTVYIVRPRRWEARGVAPE